MFGADAAPVNAWAPSPGTEREGEIVIEPLASAVEAILAFAPRARWATTPA